MFWENFMRNAQPDSEVKSKTFIFLNKKGLLSSEQPGWDSEGNGIISSQWACDEGIVDILSRNVYFCDENTINKSTMDMNASSIDDSIKVNIV